jgi:transposase-like protein
MLYYLHPEQIQKNKMLTKIKCPTCACNYAQRVPKDVLLKAIFFWLPLKKFKCRACSRVFYVVSANEAKSPV